ncbi:TIGR03084 family metal-binding protein [Marimonas lutisalis]|uniref:TIGR03084 family metal-binding protein n=1 Tax=Marimonas lutisalis TaxID=2545756 RepID=UPI0010F4FB90|nr:TIGR03084 family metal-binding protein [Marimonas lutisalis]
MTLTQAADFLKESEVLHAAIADLDARAFDAATQFKGWTINDVLVHLHFWNRAADLSAQDEAAFADLAARVMAVFERGGTLREIENAEITARGPDLRAAWIALARDIGQRWQQMDPKARLPWVGPSMSARSSMTARQMETWAHGFEVFDLLGRAREDSDRIRNIVVLGINTFGWSHQVHGLPVPAAMPRVTLTAPSGAVWDYGEDPANTITGPAVDFAAVVTQTRALADTALRVTGPVAETWMAHAQCFAGPPETPPAPGSRHRAR